MGFTPCHIPVCDAQTPLFEALLGYGIVHNFIGQWKDAHGACEEVSFIVGWKLRRDGRINEALHCIYPSYPFSMDVVVMQLGDNGTIIPLRRMIDRSRAFTVIREYVAAHLCSTPASIDVMTQVPRRFAQQSFARLKTFIIVL